ncbi:MAG: dipeptide epimerase [Calditrichia bacterium]|nr:dipeptide epimerase [Calditrichia bacterium]
MKRKEFLEVSGKSLLGLSVLSQFPVKSMARTSDKNIKSSGGVMIEVKTKRLFLKDTWTISRNSSDYKDNVFVRIEKDGVSGYGEAAPNVRYGEDHNKTTDRINGLKSLFEKYDLWHFVDLKDEIFAGITDQNCARCALDIAIMDWVGKKLNAPLYKIWGLDKSKTPLTSFSIGIDTIEVIKKKVRAADKYPLLKIKVGKENDEEIIEAVRSITDKPIRVDANEGWKSKEVALEKIKWLQSMGIEFIEQPMPSDMIEETRWLRDRVDIPIVADEAVKTVTDIPKLAEAYDGINIKLMKAGGPQEALRMIYLARALNMKIMLGCMIESAIAISAAAHLSPLVDWADLDGNLLLREDPYQGVGVEKGKLILNDKPGLGITGEF